MRRERDLPKCKRVLERMWNVLLVCFNPGGLLFETLHCHGMKVMTACVIMHNMIVEAKCDNRIFNQGFDFQGEMLSPCTNNRPCLNSLPNSIVNCVIGTLIWIFKMTWLSTCGIILATNRRIGSLYVHSRHFRFGCKSILLETILIGL